MGVPPQWYALAIATTLLNGCTLGVIAWREQNDALRRWAFAWLAWGAASAPLAALGSPEAHPVLGVLCGTLWVVSALLFLAGAYAFTRRRLPRAWLSASSASRWRSRSASDRRARRGCCRW